MKMLASLARTSWTLLAVLGLVLVTAVIGYAADAAVAAAPAANPAPGALAAFLQGTVFPIITSLLMGVVAAFLTKLGNKFHIDYLTQEHNVLEKLAFQGITLAEEKAAELVGYRDRLTGSDKVDIAVAHILQFMPKVSEERAKSLVESLLAQVSGVGATGDKAYSLGSSGVLGATLISSSVEQTAPAAV